MSQSHALKLDRDNGKVMFSDNNKGMVVGKGKIDRMPNYFIDDVLLVEGLKKKLLSVSQFYDKGNQVIFNTSQCLVINQINKQVKLVRKRINNTYMIDLDPKIALNSSCFISLNGDTWI